MYAEQAELNMIDLACGRVGEYGKTSHVPIRTGLGQVKAGAQPEADYLPAPGTITSLFATYLERLASDLDDVAGEISECGDTGTIQLAAAVRQFVGDRLIVSTPVQRVLTQSQKHADWSSNA